MPRKFDFLSPGIEITEVDQSILPAEVDADGPVIIGRFRKGPGMKPAKVRSLDYFISVYGNPIPGGSSLKGDIWRDGPQLSAPTYGAYAAQSWLASRTSPVNVVRLLGDQHPSATGDGIAGWQLSASIPSTTQADNSTAYGLFIIDDDKTGKATSIDITKATGFNENNIGNSSAGDECKLRFLKGTTDHTVSTKADGQLIEIIFDETSNAYGDVSRAATGGGSDSTVPLFTCPVKNLGGSFLEVLKQVEKAFLLAISSGDITNVSVSIDENGDSSVLKIFNLDTTTGTAGQIAITDAATSPDQFQGAGLTILGANRPAIDLDDGAAASTVAAIGATRSAGEGALAAIFYCDSGYMALKGTYADGGSTQTSSAETLISSSAANIGFTMEIYSATGTSPSETISFNFNRNSTSYVRNKFNTNPQLTNSGVTDVDDLKTYWLGETFERHLKTKVTSTTAGKQIGVLLPLQKGDDTAAAKSNWSFHRTGSYEAKSGWIIDYHDQDASGYNAETQTKLFRFESLHAGEEIQNKILIAIEELKLATNATIYPYGTFTVKVMDVNGNTLEKYSGCNLDRNSPNFVARRIGDMYMEWNDNDRRYRSFGNHPNVSDYVRIKMYDEVRNYSETALPAGFFGPGRPKTFGAIPKDPQLKSADLSVDFTGSFVTANGAVPAGSNDGAIKMGSITGVSFSFPEIPLRVNGSDGFSANPYKVYFGVRPKVDANSSLHDEDYVDYVRMLPSYYRDQAHNVTDSGFQYSYVFSLDEIVIDSAANTVTYTSGSRALSTSYTATNSFGELLQKDVKQFVVPLFGGFDGLNIKEKEAFNYDDIQASTDETTNYLVYSLNKALDSVSDPEVVPASLLAIPGIKNTHITDKIIRVAESRKDMLAVIDLVGDYTPHYESRNDASTRLGSVTDTISNLKNRAINSSYAAAYYPAVQIQDNLNNGERVWVPSSVAGLGAMAQSDAASELWFAPAGFNRGGLGNLGGRSGPRVIQARQRLDASERDKLYEVNINPIATFPNEGVVIFGQKTLQQTPSALDRINVRRLMIYLKAEISKVAQGILFDNNVRSTWSRFTAQAEPILADVQSKFGLTEYRLILDSSTTTPDLIDRNILYAKVFLKPARAIEFIAIDFVITRTGAEFA